jgi:beta-glucosidase
MAAAAAAFAASMTAAAALGACGDDPPPPITYGAIGSLSQPSGKGSFRFGAASAATQIEDMNPNTDWAVFTGPTASGGLGKGAAPVGDAARGFTMALADVDLVAAMHLDSYRFSIEWSRVEPMRNVIDENALRHYDTVIDALVAKGIRPIVTVHHFSNPVWIHDPRDPECSQGPKDKNLCGLGHPVGGAQVIEEMRQFTALLAQRYGDRVDEWATFNEPVNYLLAGYLLGYFPPGRSTLGDVQDGFIPVVRDALAAHAQMYDAIKTGDTVDADGDGVAAAVGLTLSVAEWVPAHKGQVSNAAVDVAARNKVEWIYHHLFPEAIRQGKFDTDLDQVLDEAHPEWSGRLDWLGVQYYFRAGVTGDPALLEGVTPCFAQFDLGSCLRPLDPTYCVPAMHYEHNPEGLYVVLEDFGTRWPDLPLMVTEGGIATTVGERRAENIVRSLEQIERARRKAIDIRGYYHWSLTDNFEWAEGFVPRFGLYTVDYGSYARSPTMGATVLGDIAKTRTLTTSQREAHGGTGPLSPEPGMPDKVSACN